jgi:type IV secretory pathway TrbL component
VPNLQISFYSFFGKALAYDSLNPPLAPWMMCTKYITPVLLVKSNVLQQLFSMSGIVIEQIGIEVFEWNFVNYISSKFDKSLLLFLFGVCILLCNMEY